MGLNLDQGRIDRRELPDEVYSLYQEENLIDPITREVLLNPVQLNCNGRHVISDFVRERLTVVRGLIVESRLTVINRLRCHFCRVELGSNEFEPAHEVDERIRGIWQENQDRIGFTLEEYRERILQEFEPDADAIAGYNAEMQRHDYNYFLQRFGGDILEPAFLLSDPEFNIINVRGGFNAVLHARRNLFTLNREEIPDFEGNVLGDNDLDIGLNREVNQNYNPPLHRAVEANDLNRVSELLGEGNSVNFLNDDEETPLHIAARMGHLQCIQLLIRQGADVNALDEVRNTPLHFASNNDSAEALIQNGADINRLNNRRETPVFKVLKNDHFDIAERLINEGCVINRRDHQNDSLLHIAAEKNAVNVIRALLDRQCTADSLNRRGWTPLFNAVHYSNLEASNVLADSSDLSILDYNENTVLHAAVSTLRPNREIIQGLLDREINRHAQNHQGETALTIARQLGLSQEIIDLLT